MSDFLKGNYKVKKTGTKGKKKKKGSHTEVFESKALEKLGGSIAFVMKANTFVWGDDEKA